MAVDGKIPSVNAKITEFGELPEKSAADNTAITQLESITTILNDVSGLLTFRNREKRSVEFESKKKMSVVD